MRDGGPTAVLQEPITTAEAQICLRLACSDDPLVGPGTVGGQDGLFVVGGDRRYKGDDDRGDVGRDLELEEFANGVVDAATPHDSLDDRSEVVVDENDVRSLLGDLSTGDTLIRNLVDKAEVGTGGRPALKIPAAERDRPQHPVRVKDDGA